MKKELEMIIYGVLVSGISFLMMLANFNNGPSVIKIVLITLPLVVIPLSVFVYSIYLVILDRKKFTLHFIFFGTYNVLVLSSILVLVMWIAFDF